MDIEKILIGLVSAGASGAVYFAGALIQRGRDREKFATLALDVADLKREHVKKSEHENELLEIHRRIDRHSKESDERSRESQKLLSDIGRDVSELKGFMRGRFGNKETHGEIQ